MSPGRTRTVRRAAGSLALLAAVLALPPSSLGAVSPPADGKLSPRLAELAEPAVSSLPPAAQARLLSLASHGPGSLLREDGRVLVYVRFDHGAAAAVGELRAAGARIVNVSSHYQTVTVSVRPADLRSIGAVSRVASVQEVLAPLVSATCPSGNVVSEGDQQLNAAEARSQLGVDGSGITVGILSDSFDQAKNSVEGGAIETKAAEDVASGDLPGPGNPCGKATPVNVLERFLPELPEEEELATDEGRAMAQIVHDLAPGANLAFASAFNGLFSFAGNIERLAAPVAGKGAGAKVVADDVAYLEEPFFQEGPVGVAGRHVTEAGADYFSAVGNDNLFENGETSGNEIGSWEASKYRDAGHCEVPSIQLASEELKELEEEANKKLHEEGKEEIYPELGLNPEHCMDFNPGVGVDKEFGIEVEGKSPLIVDLQWAEPWNGVKTDIDAFLIGEKGEILGASTEDNVNVTEAPNEVLIWENNTGKPAEVQLVVNKYTPGAPNPRLKFALLENGFGVSKIEYPESSGGDTVGPTVFGHSGDAGTISVGAVSSKNSSVAEPYSSRGPVAHYFGPANGVTAAAPLGSPEMLTKPDIAATDCVATTFFATQEGAKWSFCGTSAATPSAAAVAALMLQKDPGAAPAQIRNALTSTARPVGEFGPNAVGAGLIDALSAVKAMPSPPPPATRKIVRPPPPNTFIRKHPKALVRTRKRRVKLTFKFASDQAGATFQCKVDKARFASCAAKFAARFKPGKQVVKVRAVNSAGTADPTPARFRFRVKRIS